MLVFIRKDGERIVIDGNIIITMVQSGIDRATIGIECPRDIAVDREEIWLKKQQDAGKPKPQ